MNNKLYFILLNFLFLPKVLPCDAEEIYKKQKIGYNIPSYHINLISIPLDILKRIALPNLQIRDINSIIVCNKYFFKIFTGYRDISPKGIKASTPPPCKLPESNVEFDFEILKFDKKLKGSSANFESEKDLPTRIWQYNIGIIKNFPTSYFSYLQQTCIHTIINSYGRGIGPQGLKDFAKHLAGTNVHTVNLSCNGIGPQELGNFVDSLKNTNIRKIDLSRNKIDDQGLSNFAERLKGIDIHNINLSENEISDQGLRNFVIQLEDTKINNLDLRDNNISETLKIEYLENFRDSKIKILL